MTWLPDIVRFGGRTKVPLVDGTPTRLARDDSRAKGKVVTFTGALTSPNTVTVDAADGADFTFENGTTGAQNVVVVGPAGAGVTLVPGQRRSAVMVDGNLVDATAGSALTLSHAASMTALIATTFAAGVAAILAGYTGIGDGGGGVWAYDANDTTTPDDGGTVRTVGGKKVKRVYDGGTVSVKWFGAKGNDSVDDTAAITAALAAVPAGGTLYFPRGTYRTTGLLIASRGNILIRGDGMGSTFLKVVGGNVSSSSGYPEGNGGIILSGAGCTNITICDLSVFGTGSTAADALNYQTGIGTIRNTTAAGSNIVVERVECFNLAKGFVFNTSALANVTLNRCLARDIPMETSGSGDNTGYGIALAGVRGARVLHCTLSRVQRHSIYQAATGRVLYAHNTIEYHRQGLSFNANCNAFELARSQDVVIVSQLFLDNNATSLQLDPDTIASGNPFRNVTISKCIFRDNLFAEIVVGGDGATTFIPEGISIEGNTFSRVGSSNTQFCIYVQTGRGGRIAGNQFWLDNQYATQMACISFLGSSGGAFNAAQQACFTDQWEVSGNKGKITVAAAQQSQLAILSTNIATTSSAVYAVTGATSPVASISGLPTSDLYRYGKVKFILGGSRGTATFQVSLDNGVTWGATQTTAATYAIPGTGLTLAFGVGTYVLGEVQSWVMGPKIDFFDNHLQISGLVGSGSGLLYWTSTRTNPWITCKGNSPEDTSSPVTAVATSRFCADIDATGGFRKTSRVYFQNTTAASQTAVAIGAAGATEGSANKNLTRPGRPGSVTAIFVEQDAGYTAGVCTLEVRDGGSAIVDSDGVGTAVSIDGTTVNTPTDFRNGSFAAHYIPKDKAVFAAGAQLQMYITTNGAWTATPNVRGWFEYET